MKTKQVAFQRQNISCSGIADFFEDSDLEAMRTAYFSWKSLNEVYKNFNMRRANFPEFLSEGLTSVLFKWGRTNGSHFTGLPANSMDLIDINTGNMIQLKACSTTTGTHPGPTSFGPNSEFDQLIFMHMDCDTDTATWYELKADEYKSWAVNRTETIADQQAQGRRPRVVILPQIKEHNIQPIKTFKF